MKDHEFTNEEILSAIKEKEHLIWLYENSNHTGEKKMIPDLQLEVDQLKALLIV